MKALPRGSFFALVAASALAACASPQKSNTKALNGDYQRVVRNDQEFFCRREAAQGSRTRIVETCLTAAQMKELSDRGSDLLRRARDGASEPPMPSQMDPSIPK